MVADIDGRLLQSLVSLLQLFLGPWLGSNARCLVRRAAEGAVNMSQIQK